MYIRYFTGSVLLLGGSYSSDFVWSPPNQTATLECSKPQELKIAIIFNESQIVGCEGSRYGSPSKCFTAAFADSIPTWTRIADLKVDIV